MPKNKDKTTQKHKSTKANLTEWQQRNLEFLKRKREREAEQRRQEQEAREVAKSGLKALEVEENPVEESNPEPISKKREPRIPTKEIVKVLPVVILGFVMFFASLFMLTPYSKQKLITVSGLVNTQEQTVKEASQISPDDYLTTVWLHRDKYAHNIVAGDEWVKSAHISYQFPNQFKIAVDEYKIVAYTDTEEGYKPILENGKRPSSATVNDIPKDYISINLSDEKKIQEIIKQLTNIDQKIVTNIATIDPMENAATKDMLLLGMKDGHQVRIPLSKLSKRLPYYSQIVPNLAEPSIIDMEIGIYTTTEGLESIIAQNRLDKTKDGEESVDETQDMAENQEVTQ